MPKPALDFTNSAPARTTAAVASRFCSSVRKHVRVGTFNTASQPFYSAVAVPEAPGHFTEEQCSGTEFADGGDGEEGLAVQQECGGCADVHADQVHRGDRAVTLSEPRRGPDRPHALTGRLPFRLTANHRRRKL
jgi:hypothetical protein